MLKAKLKAAMEPVTNVEAMRVLMTRLNWLTPVEKILGTARRMNCLMSGERKLKLGR